jgi:hypothetical protein
MSTAAERAAAHQRYLDTPRHLRRRPPPPPPPGADLYFIANTYARVIKIGVTTNIDQRMRHLQLSCGHELALLALVPGGGVFERKLHQRFEADRTIGEWFLWSHEVLDVALAAHLRPTLHTIERTLWTGWRLSPGLLAMAQRHAKAMDRDWEAR